MRMKRRLVGIVITLLFVGGILIGGNVNAEQEVIFKNAEKNYSSLVPITVLSAGDSGEELSYYYSVSGFNQGPGDYVVNEDGSVVILDTIGSKLVYCDGNSITKKITLNENEKYLEIRQMEDAYYLEAESGQVVLVDKNGAISIIEEELASDFFYETGITNENAKKLLSLVEKENVDSDIIGVDLEGNFYTVEYEYIPDNTFIMFETSIHKYSADGNELGYAIYDIEDNVSFPRKPIKIDEDGNIYIMLCEPEQVAIYEVKLGNGDKSTLLEKVEAYEKELQLKKLDMQETQAHIALPVLLIQDIKSF